MNKIAILAASFAVFGGAFAAAPVVKVVGHGSEKVTVTLECAGSPEFAKILGRNLEISGHFQLGPSGAIKVTGAPGGVKAVGMGKAVSYDEPADTPAKARMVARQFADEMVKAYVPGGKGFATSRICFVNRKGANNAELYTCYPDGFDIRQITNDGLAAVGPRWAPNGKDVYYTGFLHGVQQIYRIDADTGAKTMLGSFKDGSTGCAVAPDGRRCAIVLAYQGNPELYVMPLGQRNAVVNRMTNTHGAAESSPCWSPDGSKIAYVSDETRNPQIYICDVASRKSRRFTATGRQNTHPDWNSDGRLVWTSLRNGQWVVMVADVSAGEKSARAVTSPGTWQDPSWAADGRHVVVARDNALFIVDTDPESDGKPTQIFYNQGRWMNPAASR